MQARHALTGQRGRARRQKKFQTFDDYFSGLGQAADIEPQDAKGQGGVNRSLGLMWIHPEDREAGLSATQESTSVDRTERSLEIRGCGEPGRNVSAKTPFQSALQTPLAGKSRYPFRRRCAPVALAANFQFSWARLPQPLHRQPQHFMFDFDIEHSPHQVPLR
jgi:hypothetical protein